MASRTLQQTVSTPPAAAAASLCPADAAACCPAAPPVPWLRLAIGLFIAAQTMTFGLAISITPPEDSPTRWLLHGIMLAATLLVAVLLGWPLAREAAAELRRGRITMELLFLAGIAGAMGISVQSMITGSGPVYFETVNILLIVYSIGHAISAGSRLRAIAEMSLTSPISMARRVLTRPDVDSSTEPLVDVAAIAPGDRVRVMPGELIPVDGRIVDGQAMVRQTAFTGDWVSTVRYPGEEVLAGTACEDGSLLIEASASGSARRVDQLARLIESARQSPTSLQRQADRFVRWFLPIVLVLSLATFAGWTWRVNWHVGLFNALAVLLVACPCAAGLATPLAIWSTIGQLARHGLIVRSGDAVERLAQADGVVFDKTGTLADERPTIQSIATREDAAERALALALVAAIERCSTHPVALVLRDIPQAADPPAVHVLALRILSCRGVEADVRIADMVTGIARITRDQRPRTDARLQLNVTLDDRWMATVILAEQLRQTSPLAISQLRDMGLPVRIMTGDAAAGAAAASELAPTLSGMTPHDKHQAIGHLRDDQTTPIPHPLFVGDGINDAAAMAVSHVSIALSSGAPLAIETASATLRSDDLRMIPLAVSLSRRTLRVIRINFCWAVAYNTVGIAVAMAGWLHPVVASVLMAMSSALVAWRSFRASSIAQESDDATGRRSDGGGSEGRHGGTKARRHEGEGSNEATQNSALSTHHSAIAARRVSSHSELHSTDSVYTLSHWFGLLGQGLVLALLASLSLTASILLLVPFALFARWITRRGYRPSSFWDMTLGMISLGGLGMNFGWWSDNAFGPSLHHACCAPSAVASMVASPWMYIGMLALGVPAMFVLRREPEVFSWRRWCCTGMLLVGVPGMVLGMWAGSYLSSLLPAMNASVFVLVHYIFMMVGMVLGMAIPHAMELLIPTTPGRSAE